MPFAWRTLSCLDAIESKHNLNIGVDVVKHVYSLKKFSGCWFSFLNKKRDDTLIFNNKTVNDRGWKLEYFSADKTTLGDEADYLLDRWSGGGKYLHLLILIKQYVISSIPLYCICSLVIYAFLRFFPLFAPIFSVGISLQSVLTRLIHQPFLDSFLFWFSKSLLKKFSFVLSPSVLTFTYH